MRKFNLCLIAILGTFIASFAQNNDFQPLQTGAVSPLPTYVMKSTDGTELTLEKAKKEKGILVVFSCNTCPFVVGNETFEGWEKQYNALFEKAMQAEVGMVLINSNEGKRDHEDSFEEMQKHATLLGYKMPYLVDSDATLANAFGARTTPHVFLFDSEFRLIYQGCIDNSWDPSRKELKTYLLDALTNVQENKTVLEASTSPKGFSIKRVKK